LEKTKNHTAFKIGNTKHRQLKQLKQKNNTGETCWNQNTHLEYVNYQSRYNVRERLAINLCLN